MARDPRVDPRPGDMLRTGDRPETGNFTITRRGRTRVTWKTPAGCEYGEDLSWFRETFKRATVIRNGDPQHFPSPPSSAGERENGGRALPFDRDTGGRFVREAWVRWAKTQPAPKASWLMPYDDIPEADKEADRQIAEAIGRWTLLLDAPRAAMGEARKGLTDIAAERQRQIDVEGWTAEHDDNHAEGAMARAAGCYAMHAGGVTAMGYDDPLKPSAYTAWSKPQHFPWDAEWWKPKDRRRDLVKAGALILAEIERIDRLVAQ